ncbi:hypothetical protein IWX49DRAFT_628697 [Phyllosticta citricarpa]|uniref:Uncharacterized protein n=1 Tax=Phyllosticta paracitricarpa TaxID=2016321 RepID=A0ABR1NE04_9PEZI
MDFIRFSPLFPSELRQGLPSALYFLLLAFAFKPPSVPVARPRFVPWLQPPPSAFAFVMVLAILVVVLPFLASFFSKTFMVGKILWEGRHPLPPQPLGLDDLVLLTPIPPRLPTPQSSDAEPRDRPANSVSLDPVPTPAPTRKETDFDSFDRAHDGLDFRQPPDELYWHWKERVMTELSKGHAKRELRDIGQRDSEGDVEMEDAPRKKVRWNPDLTAVQLFDRIPDKVYDHWNFCVLPELIEQPPQLRPVSKEPFDGSMR